MFERFTDRARRVVVLAQEESRLLDHDYIGTEHILLGLVHEGEGVAARALGSLGISLGAVRSEVEEIIGRGGSAASGHIPFTPRAKKVLELSLREALQLGHNYIGTEHILLGLLREGDGVAAQVLVKLGADLAATRQTVVVLLANSAGGEADFSLQGNAGGMFRSAAAGRADASRCSFCRRDLSEVASYAPGLDAAICDECILAASEALAAGADADRVLALRPRVTGARPDDADAVATEILAAFANAFDAPTGTLVITEVRFISGDLAEIRYIHQGRPVVGTAFRDIARWVINLGLDGT